MKLSSFHILEWLVNKRFQNCGLQLNVLRSGNYEIEYWSGKTDKPSLLLLHAFGAECKYSWVKQVESFSKKFNLIIPNLIFFGNSTVHPQEFSVKNQVAGISQLLKELKLDNFYLGAASYGGVVAAEMIREGQFNIKKLFLSNTPLKFSTPEDWDQVMRSFGTEKKSEVLVPNTPEDLKKLYKLSSFKRTYLPLFVFKKIHKYQYSKNAIQRRLLIDSFLEEQKEFRETEYKFKFPVLILWGRNDLLAPLSIGEKLAEYLGEETQFHIFEKTGHMPNLEQSKEFNSRIISFLLNNEK